MGKPGEESIESVQQAGKPAVVKGDLTGAALIAAMRDSPHRDVDVEPARTRLPIREVLL